MAPNPTDGFLASKRLQEFYEIVYIPENSLRLPSTGRSGKKTVYF